MEDICNKLDSVKITDIDLFFIKDLYFEIQFYGVDDCILPYFIEENDVVINQLADYEVIKNNTGIYDMITEYLTTYKGDFFKLELLVAIYKSILDNIYNL